MSAHEITDPDEMPADPWAEDPAEGERLRREVEIEADPEDVWAALATEEGREDWLEPDPEREILVERADEPSRLVWWWWRGDEPATRVEVVVVAAPAGSRVVVTESVPSMPTALAATFPLPALLARFTQVSV
jgi:uncharacterized protein YndB with AHSA1/START domain